MIIRLHLRICSSVDGGRNIGGTSGFAYVDTCGCGFGFAKNGVWSNTIGGFDDGEFVVPVETKFCPAFAGLRFVVAGGEVGAEVLDEAFGSICCPATSVIFVKLEMLGGLDDMGVGISPGR